jgi:hypothetical protein
MLIRMLKGVDNSVGIAFDKGIDDANIYDHRRMMSKNRTLKGQAATQQSKTSFFIAPSSKRPLPAPREMLNIRRNR